jgi:hypothetical protein
VTTAGSRRRLYRVLLGGVLVAAAAVLVAIGRREFIGYDSYWHVFIARQDRWPNFWREVRENAHPPLFYLALRAVSSWFGPGLLTYRLVSIASTVAATALVAAIVRRTTANRPLAIVAAAAFGLSYGAVMVGLEVRAYAMCAAFTLLAFMFYLDWLGGGGSARARAPLGFAAAATTAVLTHYSTFFFLAASVAATALLAVVSARWRRRLVAIVSARPIESTLMFGVPIAAAGVAYIVHVTLWGGGRLGHVPTFMYDPRSETAVGFLLRNTVNLLGIVLPGGDEFISGIYNAIQRLAGVVEGGVGEAVVVLIGLLGEQRLRAVKVEDLLHFVALNAVGGLTYRYPYGGAARHEFFLVPFAIVGFFGLIEAVRRALPQAIGRRRVTATIAACGVAASVASWTSTFHVQPQALFQPTMDEFRRDIPAPRAVLLDQFSFINFFSHYHDWQWHAGEAHPGESVWQTWAVSDGRRRMAICREGSQWSFDLASTATFDSVAECGYRTGMNRVAMFRTQWWDSPPSLAAFDRSAAAQSGVEPIVMEAHGSDVVAEFAIDPGVLTECSAPPAAPADLHVVANRDRVVTLAWAPVGAGRTSYIVEAGFVPGSADVLKMSIGRTPTYTATRVNPATYYTRVRAKNLCGVSGPSPEIAVSVK